MREAKIEELKSGDLIAFKWSDAWVSDQKVPIWEKDFEAPWDEWGAFLFVRGIQKKILVIAYAKRPPFEDPRAWVISAVPVDMITDLVLIEQRFLQQRGHGKVLNALLRSAKVLLKNGGLNPKKVVWKVIHIDLVP